MSVPSITSLRMRRSALGGANSKHALSHWSCTADLKMANGEGHAYEGGFDCEFEEKPSKGVQSECPVCLLVLREPYQATCCGYGFCRVCIERVRAENKPCPCCNAKEFNCFEDKRLKRSLYDFKVQCSNKKLGCQWVGELGKLENHLNSNPSQDKQLEGCQFTKVKCLHCSEPFQRSDVDLHQNDQCLKRPFSCEYCKDYDTSYEDVTTNHWPVCGSYPVKCPKKCSSETLERQNLESHISNDCPLTIVDCDFKHVGCKVRLPRKDLSTHLIESLVVHVSLQTKRLVDLEKENKQLKQKVDDLTEDVKTRDCSNSLLQQQLEKLKKDLGAYEIGTPLCPVEITMTDFEQHKKDKDDYYSPPFYTHPKGYKMCLWVFAGGHGDGANTHISPYLVFMKGEYDEHLKWPFRGEFTIKILSQNGDERQDMERSLTFTTGTPDKYCSRVTDGKRAKYGWGHSKFISHTRLKPRYLQNDCLKFCIEKVHVESD